MLGRRFVMRSLLSCCALALCAGAAAAADLGEPDAVKLRLTAAQARAIMALWQEVEPGTIQMTLSPAAEPKPALKYRLTPDLSEQESGNAADHYRKAAKRLADADKAGSLNKVFESISQPLDALPRGDAPALLKEFDDVLAEAEAAARCTGCDWGVLGRLREEGAGLYPEVLYQLEALDRLLYLRGRLEAAEGKFERALATVRVNLALARRCGDWPTLAGGKYGLRLAFQVLLLLEEIEDQPGCPSLYWALTDLPRPFLDLRVPLQGERLMWYGEFPGLAEAVRDKNAPPLPRDRARVLTEKLMGLNVYNKDFRGRMTIGQRILDCHDDAKKASRPCRSCRSPCCTPSSITNGASTTSRNGRRCRTRRLWRRAWAAGMTPTSRR
jgi:hypothetical protein